jgi:ArsR family transcriptional regulator, zinc-responsive transcriptional repressor
MRARGVSDAAATADRGPAPASPAVASEKAAQRASVDADAAGDKANGYESYEGAGELLRALAAPIRLAIVTELGAGERCVHELVDKLGAPQPLVSQHLRVLRGAGVVRGSRRGREIAYALVDEHVAHIVADAVSHAREAR